MIENLLALAGFTCVALAVAGLAGLLWALLFIGLVLILAAYAVHTHTVATAKLAASSAPEATA